MWTELDLCSPWHVREEHSEWETNYHLPKWDRCADTVKFVLAFRNKLCISYPAANSRGFRGFSIRDLCLLLLSSLVERVSPKVQSILLLSFTDRYCKHLYSFSFFSFCFLFHWEKKNAVHKRIGGERANFLPPQITLPNSWTVSQLLLINQAFHTQAPGPWILSNENFSFHLWRFFGLLLVSLPL